MEKGYVRSIRGSTAKAQAERLRLRGLTDRQIYGLLHETIAETVSQFRDLGGVLHVAADLRVFVAQEKNKEQQIADAVSLCEKNGIRIRLVDNPDATHAELVRQANKMLAGDRLWSGDKRKTVRSGQKGGKQRGVNAKARRNARVEDGIVRAFVALIGQKLTWRNVSKALGISITALRKHYWNPKQ